WCFSAGPARDPSRSPRRAPGKLTPGGASIGSGIRYGPCFGSDCRFSYACTYSGSGCRFSRACTYSGSGCRSSHACSSTGPPSGCGG
ncbi:MAG: hypothetical protein WAT23_19550, partial [Chromatiaceae bacterium]